MDEVGQLRAAVRAVLESKGLTGPIMAQMRVAVYTALLEQANNGGAGAGAGATQTMGAGPGAAAAVGSEGTAARGAMAGAVATATPQGRVATATVARWLKANGLEHTLATFACEVGLKDVKEEPVATLEELLAAWSENESHNEQDVVLHGDVRAQGPST